MNRFSGPFALAALLIGLHLLGPPLEALRLERSQVGAQPWRLVTGHLVHLSWGHLGLNVLGAALFGGLSSRLIRQGLWVVLGSALTVDLGLLVGHPEVDWYVGFSGVLHGVVAAVVWFERRASPEMAAVVAGGLVLKLSSDLVWGTAALTQTLVGGSVLVEAHLYGAVGGFIAAGAVTTTESRRLRSS